MKKLIMLLIIAMIVECSAMAEKDCFAELGRLGIDTNLNLKCNHLQASFPPCRCLAAVNDALHRLPPLSLDRMKKLLRICSLLECAKYKHIRLNDNYV